MAKRKTKTQSNTADEVLMVTQQGYDQMLAELDNRKTKIREEIAEAIKVARDLGDLSENQAYSDAMERKEMNEARIDHLEYLISIAQVTSGEDADDNVVNIGNTIELQKVGGDKRTITLVGKSESQEADSRVGKVSIDSPIGKAVYLARIGDTVSVVLPKGNTDYKILRKVA